MAYRCTKTTRELCKTLRFYGTVSESWCSHRKTQGRTLSVSLIEQADTHISATASAACSATSARISKACALGEDVFFAPYSLPGEELTWYLLITTWNKRREAIPSPEDAVKLNQSLHTKRRRASKNGEGLKKSACFVRCTLLIHHQFNRPNTTSLDCQPIRPSIRNRSGNGSPICADLVHQKRSHTSLCSKKSGGKIACAFMSK